MITPRQNQRHDLRNTRQEQNTVRENAGQGTASNLSDQALSGNGFENDPHTSCSFKLFDPLLYTRFRNVIAR